MKQEIQKALEAARIIRATLGTMLGSVRTAKVLVRRNMGSPDWSDRVKEGKILTYFLIEDLMDISCALDDAAMAVEDLHNLLDSMVT